MDNIEILQRIEKLEKQVELLQVEINAIKSIDVSEKTREQIDKIELANKLVSLMENLSGEKMPEAQKNEELEVLKNISQQAEIEVQSSMNILDEFIDNSVDESDFEWQSYQDGIEITKYIGFNKETVIVPELINNLPVRKIGDEVFLNCKEMHHIILPETIVELGKSVFEGSGLKEISLPSQIHKIPEYAFCLSDVSVVKCPPDIEEIDNFAFRFCRNLTTINLPNKLKRLGNSCFDDTNIHNIIIPANDVNIGGGIFSERGHIINIAFLGMNDTFLDGFKKCFDNMWDKRFVFYCLPGSSAQQYARKNDIPIKPLHEFKNDIQEEN